MGSPVRHDPNAAELARRRSHRYRWLAGAFLAPDAARLARLLAEARALDSPDPDHDLYFPAWQRAAHALRQHARQPLRLAQVHAALFNLPAGKASCPPHGWDYLDIAREELPRRLVELDRFYHQIGIAPQGHIRERSDHLCVELEALAVLCLVEASALEDDPNVAAAAREAAERFLRSHVSRWFPPFRERLHGADPLGVYAQLADAVQAFVSHDQALLRRLG